MKKKSFGYRFLILFILIVLDLNVNCQTFTNQDKLIRIIKIKTFPVSNPPPQYFVEIRNDMTISFYNNLPVEIYQTHPARLDKWGIDSTTIQLDSTDFKLLEQTLNEIDLIDIEKIENPKSENALEVAHVGGRADRFIIELTDQNIEFSSCTYNQAYISESAKIIRNIFEKLEEKYKPKK
jgi:hypothetical protein